MKEGHESLPKSISHWIDPFVIVAVIALSYVALRASPLNNLFLAIAIVLSVSIVMVLIEFFRAPWSPIRYRPKFAGGRTFSEALHEATLQWIGLLLYLCLILFAWWLLAEYYRPYYKPFFEALPLILTYGPPLTAIALLFAELWIGPAQRGGKELGLLIIRSLSGNPSQAWKSANWITIRDEFLSWVLWGFFLPLNFVEIVRTLGTIRGNEHLVLSDDWVKAQYYIIMMIYGSLIAAITPGYLFSSRLIRTDTKMVDHSWFAWTITLICYDPLVSGVFGRWFDYRADSQGEIWIRPWATAFDGWPLMLLIIGGLIIFFELIHLWGEAQFGLRAANISNRGIITTGLYRLTKHPIYVSKCAGWLLIWVPFMAAGSAIGNLRYMILWGFVCVIYALRGLAEEKLLSKDPEFVRYALWIDKHGMFAWVGRFLPIMTFEYRLKKWQEAEVRER
ncbi:MAG: hypothetical protein RIQ56_479 [Candidatus Parcubacteria bacterium]|jgi:protein-S-isoprenylcysteine O-methyltransferase Ste14